MQPRFPPDDIAERAKPHLHAATKRYRDWKRQTCPALVNDCRAVIRGARLPPHREKQARFALWALVEGV